MNNSIVTQKDMSIKINRGSQSMTPAPATAPAWEPFQITIQATFSPDEIESVNQWLTETGKIEPWQSFTDLPEDYKLSIIKRPEAFRAAVLNGAKFRQNRARLR